jgi:hypothetical protein
VLTDHADMGSDVEGGKKVEKGGYIAVVDHGSSPRDWISKDEMDCGAVT